MKLQQLLNEMLKSERSVLKEIETSQYSDTIEDIGLLYNLIDYMDNKAERNKFWDCIIFYISPQIIDEKCFEYFFKNDIALLKLSHMQLRDEQLEKLSKTYEDALFTLANRFYCSDKYNLDQFREFLQNCQSENVMNYLLNIGNIKEDKYNCIIGVINSNTVFSSKIKEFAKEIEHALLLEKTNDVILIKNGYETGNYRYLLSISKNINTPKSIIAAMCNITGVKFASKIRANSAKTLKCIN